MHYHVMSGMFGCLPDMNELFHTKEEAKRFMRHWRDDCREAGVKLRGSIEEGYFRGNGVAGVDYIEMVHCVDRYCHLEDRNI